MKMSMVSLESWDCGHFLEKKLSVKSYLCNFTAPLTLLSMVTFVVNLLDMQIYIKYTKSLWFEGVFFRLYHLGFNNVDCRYTFFIGQEFHRELQESIWILLGEVCESLRTLLNSVCVKCLWEPEMDSRRLIWCKSLPEWTLRLASKF